MASRWRKTTMCYESVPIEEERTQQFKELPNPEQSIQSLDQCNQQSEYLTYDTAPTVVYSCITIEWNTIANPFMFGTVDNYGSSHFRVPGQVVRHRLDRFND
ncbi:hypothetical protein RDWZM_001370 [Blomia tropicalis]|uniref:Uncharacterized protein n=1 Tax=Blomia tropicalis TaxID=40697 RepID=A0A9Q0MBG6_BLOTA|nr:hypothetical protein RDWZM_001370 [Blomia tropicalis]